MGGEGVGHLLVGKICLVVGVDRAAGDLGPAIRVVEPFDALGAGDRVAEASRARVDVVGGDVAELQADRAAIRLKLHGVLRHLDAHQIVVGAKIGLPKLAVRLDKVGVDRHHRDRRGAGGSGCPSTARWTARSRSRPHPGQKIVDDLHLACLVRAGGRTGVEALVLRVGVLALPLLAAEMNLLEERIVETLHDDRERLLLSARGARRQAQNARATKLKLRFITSASCCGCRPVSWPTFFISDC